MIRQKLLITILEILTHYDKQNRRVGVLVSEEVEVLISLDLDVGSESDEGQTSDDENKVE